MVLHRVTNFCHMYGWLWTRFRLVFGFIEHLQKVTASNYSAIANSRTLQSTRVRTGFSLFCVFTSRCLVTASNAVVSSTSVFTHFFFNLYSGGWSTNWVHWALRPLTGLLYLPRVIVRMENLMEWMAGETEVLGENLPRRLFVHHKSHLTRSGIEPEPPRWEASD
jgi:hypothetical protein